MGIYYDVGRPVVGGWIGGPWISHDPIQKRDLIWGGEFGQEGANLFAIDVDSGEIVAEHRIGAREFNGTVDPKTGRLWIYTYHGLNQPGNMLLSWRPEIQDLAYHGFPSMSGQRFVGAVLGDDGRVYLGTHPFGHLVSFDPNNEVWYDHGCQAPDPIVPDQQIWCRPHSVNEGGEIICNVIRTRPGQWIAYDPTTGTKRELAAEPDGPAPTNNTTARNITVRNIEANIYEGTYAVDGESRLFTYQPKVATDIVGLNKGPDGKIYGSTIISMHIFSFDPEKRALADLGRVGFGHGEVYDVIAHEDKLYLGSYTGAYWAVYDPAQPWNPSQDSGGLAADANPRCFGQLGSNMNRPFEYAVGPDTHIYIACRANYGISGGGLGRFDPQNEEIRVFVDEEQSVQCVAADGRFVYGGTSISGGRGCIEPTTQGKLFVFDPQTDERIFTCIPDGHAVAVTSLAVSSANGLVYGSTSAGMLFAFDCTQRQVVQTWRLRSLGTPLMGVPETYGIIHLTAGSDGHIYGVTNSDLFRLDIGLGQILYLDPPPIPDLYQIVEGQPGLFYIGARGHLLEYHLNGTPHYR